MVIFLLLFLNGVGLGEKYSFVGIDFFHPFTTLLKRFHMTWDKSIWSIGRSHLSGFLGHVALRAEALEPHLETNNTSQCGTLMSWQPESWFFVCWQRRKDAGLQLNNLPAVWWNGTQLSNAYLLCWMYDVYRWLWGTLGGLLPRAHSYTVVSCKNL